MYKKPRQWQKALGIIASFLSLAIIFLALIFAETSSQEVLAASYEVTAVSFLSQPIGLAFLCSAAALLGISGVWWLKKSSFKKPSSDSLEQIVFLNPQ